MIKKIHWFTQLCFTAQRSEENVSLQPHLLFFLLSIKENTRKQALNDSLYSDPQYVILYTVFIPDCFILYKSEFLSLIIFIYQIYIGN